MDNKNRQLLKSYSLYVNDFESSPFELVEMLHIRDSLQEQYHNLSTEEKLQLTLSDTQLILNAKEMATLIGNVFDFDSPKPSSGWWWELNLIANRLNESFPKLNMMNVLGDVV
ncbi:MAG: hypothetical protein ACXVC1_06100 [Tumebacillaceae bacterium]